MSDFKPKTVYTIEVELDLLLEILEVVENSEGVAGWNTNGSTAKWEEFEWVKKLKKVVD